MGRLEKLKFKANRKDEKMGNSWKAKCVEILNDNGWKIGDIIEVVDGIVIESNIHGWGGIKDDYVKSFENWSTYQSKYTKWELITDEPVTPTTDNINPSHYKSQCSLECIVTGKQIGRAHV